MKIYQLNENDYYKADSLDQAITTACTDTGMTREELTEGFEPKELTELDLERLTYCDGDTPPEESPGWKCEAIIAGQVCGCLIGSTTDPVFRWNGATWEHWHGYPLGHVVMTEYRERTFAAQLAIETAGGDNEPRIFASSEY